jgi:hypothetical protein
LGSTATLVLAGLLSGTTPADAQFYYGGPPPANRWVHGSRSGGYYVPGGVMYGEPGRARWQNRGGDALKAKAQNDLKKAVLPPPVKGPLLIAVSIANQRLTLYDDGVPIAHSPVSTGTASHPTPTGVFSVIGKARFHRSNLYSSAPMPFMQRITWSGVALHAGQLPGYPASHGCIRLPYEFAIRLFNTTKMGARVIISHQELTPTEIAHARLFVPKAKPAPAAAVVAASLVAAKPESVAPPAAVTPKPDIPKAEAAADKPVQASTPTDAPQSIAADAREAAAAAIAKADATSKAEPEPVLLNVEPPKAEAPKVEADKPEAAKPELAKAEPAKVETSPTLKIAELRPAVSSDAPRIVPERQLRQGPVSVFVSRKEKRLYVRKGFEPVFEMPVEIADADRPLGTHVFTAMALGEEGAPARWSVVTMPPERAKSKHVEPVPERRGRRAERARIAEVAVAEAPQPVASAAEALNRITMPQAAVDRISELMSVGASLVISDQGLGPETGLETDFVVLTR